MSSAERYESIRVRFTHTHTHSGLAATKEWINTCNLVGCERALGTLGSRHIEFICKLAENFIKFALSPPIRRLRFPAKSIESMVCRDYSAHMHNRHEFDHFPMQFASLWRSYARQMSQPASGQPFKSKKAFDCLFISERTHNSHLQMCSGAITADDGPPPPFIVALFIAHTVVVCVCVLLVRIKKMKINKYHFNRRPFLRISPEQEDEPHRKRISKSHSEIKPTNEN